MHNKRSKCNLKFLKCPFNLINGAKLLHLDCWAPYQIIDKLEEIFNDNSLHKTEIYHWLTELRRGRIDLNDEPKTIYHLNEDHDRICEYIKINHHNPIEMHCIINWIKLNYYFSQSYSHGFKYMLLLWVLHILNDFQKKQSFSFAKIMLHKHQILKHDNFR